MSDPLPRITIVTPSFQQARFLERTINSVLDQRYPNLEYMIVDGGSTDGSLDIIRRHASRLAWWCSEKDSGQAAAINKGLRRATGEIVGWLNSDDTLAGGALHAIAEAYRRHPEVDLLYGHTCQIDEDDRVVRRLCAVPTTAKELIYYNPNMFSQPGTTWRRGLQGRVGLLDESLHYKLDCDFWIRAALAGKLGFLSRHLGNLRSHPASKSAAQAAGFAAEQRLLDARYNVKPVSPLWRRTRAAARGLRILASPASIAYRFGLR